MEKRVKEIIEKHKVDKDLTKEKIEPGWDWSRANLCQYDLSGLCLSDIGKEANFEGANFVSANLKGVSANYANFKNSDFSGANLIQGLFLGSNFEGAILKYTSLDNTNFCYAILDMVDLSKAILYNTFFDGASLENINLTDVEIDTAGGLELAEFKKINETDSQSAYYAYFRLERYMKQKGQVDRAGEFYFKRKLMERKKYLKGGNYLLWLWSHLFSKLCGYGEHVWKIVAIIFGILILFTCIFYLGDGITIDRDVGYPSSIYECGYFSIVTFTTLGFGDYEPKPHFQAFAAIEALLGYFMLSLFVITLARKVMR